MDKSPQGSLQCAVNLLAKAAGLLSYICILKIDVSLSLCNFFKQVCTHISAPEILSYNDDMLVIETHILSGDSSRGT
jgi:hypothetical protein